MQLFHKLKNADQLVKNTSWMMTSEVISKISRVLTVIVMAAFLAPVEYGIAALAIACHELVRVFSRAGAGARVIQCNREDLPLIARNASLLQWGMCSLLFVVQLSLAPYLANFYDSHDLQQLLVLMAMSYFCFPLVAVKVFILQRQNRIQYFGLVSAACISVENIGTVILLFLDFGLYSIAYAKLASAAIWALLFGLARVEYFAPRYDKAIFWSLFVFSLKIFSSELLRTLRSQIDVLLAGKLLSPEILGFYSFAKNAGVGLGQSLVCAYTSGLFPWLCDQIRQGNDKKALQKSLKYASLLSLVFLLQSASAPIYITLLFGSQWGGAWVLVSILCLGAIPGILIDTGACYFRASNKPAQEFLLILQCLAISSLSIILISPNNGLGLSLSVLFASYLWLPLLYSLFLSNRACIGAELSKV